MGQPMESVRLHYLLDRGTLRCPCTPHPRQQEITMAFAARPPPEASPDRGAKNVRHTSHPLALGMLTAIFFMWGFLTCLNDILIPHLKSAFQRSFAQVMLVCSSPFSARTF
jgi:hypothetical protein